jgi:2-polyprenyl-3-methyl-5-hydroxy-6-metoxy-1,4-benzoquinol methylase
MSTPSNQDAQSTYYAATRPELKALLPQGCQRVLEVGCGRGGFRANLPADAQVWGVEPNAVAAQTASQHLNRVLVGTYEAVQQELPDQGFDLVVCNDVIEHMVDDAAFLNAVRSKMAPGAYLFGSVPNLRNLPVLQALLFGKDFHYQDAGVLDRTHLRFYTEKSFTRLLAESGFEAITLQGINRKLRPASLWWRLVLWLPQLRDTRWQQFAFIARLKPSA